MLRLITRAYESHKEHSLSSYRQRCCARLLALGGNNELRATSETSLVSMAQMDVAPIFLLFDRST